MEPFFTHGTLKEYFKDKSEDFLAGYQAGLTQAIEALQKDFDKKIKKSKKIKITY